MDIKNLIEPQALESLRSMNSKVTDLARGITSSPLMEAMRQLEEQQKTFRQPFVEISQALSIAMPPYLTAIQEITKGFSPLIDQITRMHSPYQELMKSIEEQTRPFQDSLRQFRSLQEQLNFPEINKAFHGITDYIRSIPREHLIKVRLHSEYWLIGDDNLLALVVEHELYENEEVVPFMISYYKANDWKQLKNMVNNWSADIDIERLKVFQTAVALAQGQNQENIHLLTVPALIAQIDGLIRELYAVLPKATKKRVEKEIKNNLPAELKGKRADVRNEVAVQTIAEVVDYWSAEMLQEVIFSGLFRDSNQITPDSSYSLFRHKIMHGDKEYLGYGNEENFIRLMLYAEFIINLFRELQAGTIVIDVAA